jgi:hypothetical protein
MTSSLKRPQRRDIALRGRVDMTWTCLYRTSVTAGEAIEGNCEICVPRTSGPYPLPPVWFLALLLLTPRLLLPLINLVQLGETKEPNPQRCGYGIPSDFRIPQCPSQPPVKGFALLLFPSSPLACREWSLPRLVAATPVMPIMIHLHEPVRLLLVSK